MKILHILEDYSSASGGIRTVVKSLNEKLNRNDEIKSYVISAAIDENEKVYKKIDTSRPWLYSSDWIKTIKTVVKEEDINVIHIHGVWMFPQYIAAKFAIKQGIPFILTPHGMYEPWLWSKGRIKKVLYFKIFTQPFFKKASIIHAITDNERKNLKKLFPKTKIGLIPNLIDVVDYYSSDSKIDKYILFVGRIDKKKGIDILIKSFARLKYNNLKLKIAGKYDDYKNELDKLTVDLDISNKVEFLGLIKGKVKEEVYKNAFVFVAPSHSEVIGMVNLEAAIYGTPVITTFQTGLNTKWNENGGMLINPNEEELFESLQTYLSLGFHERNINGKNLYNFVKKEYSWENRFLDWVNLYKECLFNQSSDNQE